MAPQHSLFFTSLFLIIIHVHASLDYGNQLNHVLTKDQTLKFEQSGTQFHLSKIPDWLISKIDSKTNLIKTKQGTLVLTNGLISREFSVKPDFTTIDFISHEKQSSILRALSPEAKIHINDISYNVGNLVTDIPRAYMNRTALAGDMRRDPDAFHYTSHQTHAVEAPFPYKPRRGAPKDIVWPPKGLRLDVSFEPPQSASSLSGLTVIIHYEMYDGIPLMSKWVTIKGSHEDGSMRVGVSCVEYLAVNNQWGSASWGQMDQQDYHFYQGGRWLFVETDQSHGTVVDWNRDPSADSMPGSFEPVVNVTYQVLPSIPLGKDGFVSFRVHELAVGSSDLERGALARHKMLRLLAPQTQENPIFFHMTNSSSEAVRQVIDQLAEVGFEMMIYSFGSGFNIESTDMSYLNEIKSDIAYANSKGIEVGGYDLISLSRQVQSEWMAVNSSGQSIGSACFASGWYDFLFDRFKQFIEYTGLSMVETDGPYGGYSCASTNHSHHTDVDDSIYYQQQLQGQFYKWLREKEVYINQPDYFFYQGGSKTGMGYNENQYSLPRWQDITVSRQSVYDDTYKLIPTAGWMFVPIVDYHGGGDAAMFEPLEQHLVEFEWALAQYLGAGVAACYRGYRIYDTPKTKALVMKWVSFYKRYRDILTSDIVHVRRPDMQSIDCFMHVNPHIDNKGLAMVFNPTDRSISTALELPVYYTGMHNMTVLYEKGEIQRYHFVDRDYNIQVPVTLGAKEITWFLLKEN